VDTLSATQILQAYRRAGVTANLRIGSIHKMTNCLDYHSSYTPFEPVVRKKGMLKKDFPFPTNLPPILL